MRKASSWRNDTKPPVFHYPLGFMWIFALLCFLSLSLRPVDPAEENRAEPPCSGLHQVHTATLLKHQLQQIQHWTATAWHTRWSVAQRQQRARWRSKHPLPDGGWGRTNAAFRLSVHLFLSVPPLMWNSARFDSDELRLRNRVLRSRLLLRERGEALLKSGNPTDGEYESTLTSYSVALQCIICNYQAKDTRSKSLQHITQEYMIQLRWCVPEIKSDWS